MVITSLAGTISIFSPLRSCLASSAFTTCGCPTSITRTPSSRAASTLPSTSGRGALSPPIASTAIVIIGAYCRFWVFQGLHLQTLSSKRFQGFRGLCDKPRDKQVVLTNPELKKERLRISNSGGLLTAGRLYAAVLFRKSYARTSFT